MKTRKKMKSLDIKKSIGIKSCAGIIRLKPGTGKSSVLENYNIIHVTQLTKYLEEDLFNSLSESINESHEKDVANEKK